MVPTRYRVISYGFGFVGLYHLAALTVPEFGRVAYSANYPPARHMVFIAINFAFAWLMRSGAMWLIWPYSLAMLQVMVAHGTHVWQTWQEQRHFEWTSVTVMVAVIVGFGLLWTDRQARRC
jgi:hypothetical protein